MKILFKFTTRSRPHLFHRGMMSILNNVTSDDFHILVSVDNDDVQEVYSHPYKNTTVIKGVSKSKIDAINRDVNEFDYDFDVLVNMSDDMVFTEKGFDEVIREVFIDYFNGGEAFKSLDKCLHFPDGNRNDLITMAIMGRDYYKRFNYIYHPEYKSLYCDNEMTDVAMLLGCYRFVNKNIVYHLHPAYGKGIFDAQYRHTESFGSEDRETYLKRKAIKFGL
jgi:hypothetical protein